MSYSITLSRYHAITLSRYNAITLYYHGTSTPSKSPSPFLDPLKNRQVRFLDPLKKS